MVTIATTTPAKLLERIKAGIDDGSIKTWSYDTDGDFTHNPTQWNKKAWLRPSVTTTGLELNFIAPTGGAVREVFAVYQGRFQEMMMSHFYNSYTTSCASPRPTSVDSAVAA
jgi:hypothetical protein